MPTYDGNAYEILSQVRYGINEHSDALVQGTDTTGAFRNPQLVKQINSAQSYLWSILFGQFPEYFLKNDDINVVDSTADLPSDCFKIKEVVADDLLPVIPILLAERHSGSKYKYYRVSNQIRIDTGVTLNTLFETDPDGEIQPKIIETYSIWYYKKCRDLDTGVTSAGGAASATLATTAKGVADYYNGMSIENVTDSTVDTISDYSAARVATVTNTWASSKYYGIVSELPEIFHPLISEYAILQLKKDPRVPLQVSSADIGLFQEMLRESLKSFAGTLNGDVSLASVLNNFNPYQNYYG